MTTGEPPRSARPDLRDAVARSTERVGGLVGDAVGDAVRRVASLAERLDRSQEAVVPVPHGPSLAAQAWAVAKVAGMLAGAPVGMPTLALAARRTAADCVRRVERFGEHVTAVAQDRPSPLPALTCTRLDGTRRWLITSDLHRCIPGRVDWPERQGTKDLYPTVLEHYAERGWGLVENGDVEDFWMVGGSAWGAVYDIARIAGGIIAPVDDTMRLGVLADQLDRTVENNARTYRVITEGFLRPGRYHRTLGNHDEAFLEPELASKLEEHLPGGGPVDSILLVDPPAGGDADSVRDLGSVRGFVAHGHLTDSWNGPGYSGLGRAITWLGLGLDDLPTPTYTDDLPDEEAVERLLAGRGRNRLITLDPRFGGNRRFDSLDEVRLFGSLRMDEPSGGWPWMLFGHTHYPMLRPTDGDGRTVRYANSGSGVLDRAVSALEWDPDAGEEPVRLVLWHDDGSGRPRRHVLVPDGPRLALR